MKELSLHVLDIAENGISAGASLITICIDETYKNNFIFISIKDNGHGIQEKMLPDITGNFITSRTSKTSKISGTTKRVGMGLSLLKVATQKCNGHFSINSVLNKGVCVQASFEKGSIDIVPLGDMASSMIVLFTGYPDTDFNYTHIINEKKFTFDTRDIRVELEDVPLNNPSVIKYLKEYLKEEINDLQKE